MRFSIARFGLLAVFMTGVSAYGADAKSGKALMETRGCVVCHALGGQGAGTAGPDLAGVTKLRERKWLQRWLKDPESMRKDPAIRALQVKYPMPMPAQDLSEAEVDDILAFLETVVAPKAK